MSDPRHDRLPDDVRRVLDEVADEPGPDAAAHARLWGRLADSLDLPIDPGDGGQGGDGGDGGPGGAGGDGGVDGGPAGIPPVPPVPIEAGVTAALKSTLGAALAAHPIPVAVGLFALGTASGIGLHATVLAPAPPAVIAPAVIASAPPPPPEPQAAPAPEPADPGSPAPSVTVRRKVPAPAEPIPSSDEALAEERALVEMARTALSRKDPDAALDAIRKHETLFGAGRLAEERDFLRVQALAVSGRVDEANEALAAFQARYPRSFFTPVLQKLLRPGPSK